MTQKEQLEQFLAATKDQTIGLKQIIKELSKFMESVRDTELDSDVFDTFTKDEQKNMLAAYLGAIVKSCAQERLQSEPTLATLILTTCPV